MNRSTPGLPVRHQLLEFTQTHIHILLRRRNGGIPSGSLVKYPPAMQETWVPSLGGEDPLEESSPLQYSCLENPVDRGAWRAMVDWIARSRTRQYQLSTVGETGKNTSTSSSWKWKFYYLFNSCRIHRHAILIGKKLQNKV